MSDYYSSFSFFFSLEKTLDSSILSHRCLEETTDLVWLFYPKGLVPMLCSLYQILNNYILNKSVMSTIHNAHPWKQCWMLRPQTLV